MPVAPRPAKRSWWLEEALALPEFAAPEAPALTKDTSADVVILGGGYTGMWTAWFLKEREPDLDVVLLEADICGGGPSGRNGGFCDGWWGHIGDMIATYGEADALELLMTCGRSPAEIGAWCEANGVDAWFTRGGDLAVARLHARRPVGTFDQLGRATASFVREGQLVLAFFGQMLISGARLIRSPRSANWRELPATMERSGADAVPIVVAINFLVGVAMAFQAAAQLKRFGANLLVANLIGISITRELAPLMTAIVVCGRSGAAFAAELGFMQVNGEIDALRTMGLRPLHYLVLPRTLALIVVVPLLVLLADVAGMLGGLLVGVWNLELTVRAYVNQTARVVSFWDIESGVIKSMAFAVAIALIACQQGLATSGGAEGVGRRTTSAVVLTLFTLILFDAAITVLFRVAGL
jgi:phospholipid/cholesterol/gamma-HCH transport system permease protein